MSSRARLEAIADEKSTLELRREDIKSQIEMVEDSLFCLREVLSEVEAQIENLDREAEDAKQGINPYES